MDCINLLVQLVMSEYLDTPSEGQEGRVDVAGLFDTIPCTQRLTVTLSASQVTERQPTKTRHITLQRDKRHNEYLIHLLSTIDIQDNISIRLSQAYDNHVIT